MASRAKELPSHLGDVQRRLKRGYHVERTSGKGGHFRVVNPEGEYVANETTGRALTLSGQPGARAVQRMEAELRAADVLKPKRRPSKPSPSSRRGIEAMRQANRAAQVERREKAMALRKRMTPWMKTIGYETPGVVWDLARYLHQTSDGVFPTPESAVHTIRNVMSGNGVRDETREALELLSAEFEAEPEPLALYVDIARQARGIDTSEAMGEAALPSGREWPFTVKLIEIDACFADLTYQRPVGERFVREIVLNFDERLVGTIQVSARADGRFAILDGQTRWKAMQLVGKRRCWAAIYEGLDEAAEARFFYRVNKHRKGVHSFYGFRARVLSGEEKAVRIQRLVEQAGLKISPNTSGETSDVAAVSALEWVYDLDSPHREDTLSPVLRVMGTTWAGLKRSTDAELMRGLGRFYAAYGDDEIVEQPSDRFQDLLVGIGPQLLIQRARDVAGTVVHNRAATGLAMAKAIVALHNTGLGRAARLDAARLERYG